jgi:hypothetical protein
LIYEGWVDSKQYQVISESNNKLSDEPIILNSDLVEYVTGPSNLLYQSSWSFAFVYQQHTINTGGFDLKIK